MLTGLDDTGTPVTLIYDNSAGVLTQASNSITGVYYGEARWSDFDNDGDLDIFVIGLDSEDDLIAEIWKNQNGAFIRDDNQTLTGLRYASVSWGDYDRDGLTDAITTGMNNLGEPKTILYRNEKVGLQYLLMEELLQPLLNIAKGSASFGDIDDDGDLDLAISGFDATGFANAAVYKNEPLGFFTYDNRNSPLLQKSSSGSLLWFDSDADGFQDILQTGLNSVWEAEISLFENERDGSLSDNLLSSTTDVAGKIRAGDLTNDGLIDVAVSGKNESSTLFGTTLDGQPDGSFDENLLKFGGVRDGDLALADYDNDGKLDILVSGVNSSGEFTTILYRNSTAGAGSVPQPPASIDAAVVTNDRIIRKLG